MRRREHVALVGQGSLQHLAPMYCRNEIQSLVEEKVVDTALYDVYRRVNTYPYLLILLAEPSVQDFLKCWMFGWAHSSGSIEQTGTARQSWLKHYAQVLGVEL